MNSFVAEDLLKMRFVGGGSLSPTGKEVLFVKTQVEEEENGYSATVMKFSADNIIPIHAEGSKIKAGSPAWSADGKVAYLANNGGKNQLWLRGKAAALTQFSQGVASFIWAPDGRGIYAVSKEVKENPKFRKGATVRHINKLRYKANGAGYLDGNPAQLWYVSLAGVEPRQLTFGDYDCSQPTVSPCGRYLAFVSNREDDELNTLEDIWLLDLESKELTNLTKGKGRSSSPRWLADGKLIYLGHQKGIYPGGYPELRQIELATGANENLMPDYPHYIGNSIGGDVRYDSGNAAPLPAADGRHIYFSATIGGNCYLYGLDVESGKVTKIFGEGQMVISSFDVRGEHLVVNVATPSSPGDLWWGPLNAAPQQISAYNDDLFKDKYIGQPEEIHFTHADGTQLEGWLIKPRDYVPGNNKYPLVMEIHGGPHTTYGNVFFHEWQILAGQGMGVFYSNPRGSLGYGEDFARAVVGDWCGIDARDLQFMAEETAKLPWVDEKRLGVTGGSQGGYFTNWLISQTDMFAAAVTQRSMSNLYSKYGVADNGWNGDRYGMGGKDLWEDEDFVMERSPMRYARNVKTPTLIIHSDEDYRCPLEQAEQWYVALRRLGVKVEMLLFHGENHELSRGGRPANRIVRLEGIVDWFKRHL